MAVGNYLINEKTLLNSELVSLYLQSTLIVI